MVCGAVNVICELARKNPKNYLPLAPQLFKLLTSSSNNWMLIKVVKLLGELVSEEPRLARKILEPLSKLIRTTTAKSLLYECVRTVTRSLPYTKREDGRQPKILPQIVKLCMSNLKNFVEDSDQNLKYLGLAGLRDLMSFAPQVVKRNRNLVLECLQDPDISIRLRALDLLEGIVSKENLVNIIDRLSREALETEDPHYRDEIVQKIVTLCSKDKFKLVQDFAWYVKILVNLVRGSETKHADDIATQLTQVSLRVPSVRSYLVKRVQPLLTESGMMLSTSTSVESVLYAAAWIVGEYAEHVTRAVELICALLQPSVVQSRSGRVQAMFLSTALKIVIVRNDEDEEELKDIVLSQIKRFKNNTPIEVQERARDVERILDHTDDVADTLRSVFEKKLKPVSERAQRKVPIPKGLDLNAVIDPRAECLENEDESNTKDLSESEFNFVDDLPEERMKFEEEEEEEEEDRKKKQKKNRKRKKRRRKQDDPFYLSNVLDDNDDNDRDGSSDNDILDELNVSDIPIKRLEDGELVSGDDDDDDDDDDDAEKEEKEKITYTVMTDDEMPDGASSGDEEPQNMNEVDDEDDEDLLKDVVFANTSLVDSKTDKRKKKKKKRKKRKKVEENHDDDLLSDIFDTTSSPVKKNDVEEMSDLFASLGDADISRTPTKTSEVEKKELSDFTPLSETNEGDHEKKQRRKKKKSKSRKKKRKKRRKSEDGDLLG